MKNYTKGVTLPYCGYLKFIIIKLNIGITLFSTHFIYLKCIKINAIVVLFGSWQALNKNTHSPKTPDGRSKQFRLALPGRLLHPVKLPLFTFLNYSY